MKQFILDRLKEPSTWRGLAAIATSMGIIITPFQLEVIMSAGMAVIGAIGVLSPDKQSGQVEQSK